MFHHADQYELVVEFFDWGREPQFPCNSDQWLVGPFRVQKNSNHVLIFYVFLDDVLDDAVDFDCSVGQCE